MALAKQQSTGPAGAGPGRPTHLHRRATDAVAPIQSNDSERSPRSAGVRSSAGVPPDGQRHDDCRHGALTTMTRATARCYWFLKSKGRGRARLAAEGLASLQESKGDANGVSGVNFRHPPTLRTKKYRTQDRSELTQRSSSPPGVQLVRSCHQPYYGLAQQTLLSGVHCSLSNQQRL